MPQRFGSNMTSVNFELASAGHSIELHALGLNWDLHNFANFVGLQLSPDSSAILTWVVPDTANPWGDTNNHHGGCKLRFSRILRLSLTGRDVRMPASEDEALAEITEFSDLTTSSQQNRERADACSGFRFTFHSGVSIEIVAAEAELIPIARPIPTT